MEQREPTAAAIIIGNEILSGKVEEQNARLLVRELRELGVALKAIHVIADEVDVIARFVRECSAAYDHVFTSGGVGPTHDDTTLPGIAAAFGLRIVRHPPFEELLRAAYGERINDFVLRMAEVPEGAELLAGDALRIPVLRVRNVFVLPGVPHLFARKLAALREQLRATPFALRKLFVAADESSIAPLLAAAQELRLDVEVGSYPIRRADGWEVMVTVESRDAAAVDAVATHLVDALGEQVLRTE